LGVILGGVMVIVLAIGPKVKGSNPAESYEFLRTIRKLVRLSPEKK
jgi:hypothetical protein